MNTDLNGKRQGCTRKIVDSFSYAIQGIIFSVKKERNIKIHLAISLFVILAGLWLNISVTEWLFISLAIGGILSLEMVNTAIERAVDLATEDLHPLAKQAKDIAAGAVLIYAVVSVVVGILIFLPKLLP